MGPSIFLNLDGTVHPLITQYRFFHGLKHVGPRPFCWAEAIRPLIEQWDAAIVIRSSATQNLGLEAVKELAPDWMQPRIVGSAGNTLLFISYLECRKVNTSYGVICRHVRQHEIKHWVAIDDKDDGWPQDSVSRKHLVLCNPDAGVQDAAVLERLDDALKAVRDAARA